MQMACKVANIPSINKDKMAMLCPKITTSDLRGLPYKLQSNADPYVLGKVNRKAKNLRSFLKTRLRFYKIAVV